MSRRYKFYNQDELYFVTYATVGWVDVFTRVEYVRVILDSLKYCSNNKGLDIYAWCIMTNHVHLIIGTHGNKLEDILRDHKRHTSELLKAAILNGTESRREWMMQIFVNAGLNNSNNKSFQFWQQHNKPIALTSLEMLNQKLQYLHFNPVKAGFVDKAEDWFYSSARDYYTDSKGLLDCVKILEAMPAK